MTERASFAVAPGDLPGVRSAVSKLAGYGYCEKLVRERLGLDDLANLRWRPSPIYRAERLSAGDPLALAIDLFQLQGSLPADELLRIFAPVECELLVRTGLLAIDDTGLARARAALFPVGDLLIFSDHAWPELPHPGLTTVPSDQVMAVGMDSRHLARCTTRRRFQSVLDLCTGSGIHALLAAKHAHRVLAADINPRAAACARFNAQVSGIDNVDVVVSDVFEALREERFDLITANPPFVPSPLDSLQFRDGGRSGEDVQKRIVADLPSRLAPGGIAQIVTELGERDGEPLASRLRQWLNGAPMDIHILRLGEHTAMAYATGHAKGDDYGSYLDSVDAWAGNLQTQGYPRVVSVVLSFAWSDAKSGSPWERVEECPPPKRDAGPEIDDAFVAERLARRTDLPEVLKRSWVARAGPIALIDAQVLGSDIEPRAKATLLGQSLTVEHHLDPLERDVLTRLDDRIFVPELMKTLPEFEPELVIEALRSLLRRRLVGMHV
jgi:SAM-dependent methyltransferase